MFMKFVHAVTVNKNYRELMTLCILTAFCKINVKKLRFYKHVLKAPLLTAVIWGKQEKSTVFKREVLLNKADDLFDQGKYDKIYQLLNEYQDTNEVEILWRLARALYKMSETASEVEKRKLVYDAYDLICKALNIQENHFTVHKWMAILLDKTSEFKGMKERIKQLANVKKHMLKASELNPQDPTIFYMLGNWCYHVSDLNWYQKKIATALFTTPPDSSFEEASRYFEQAEAIEPMFYSYNLLMLGKTCLKLKKKEDAVKYLKKASEYIAKTDEDLQVKQEATKLLSSL